MDEKYINLGQKIQSYREKSTRFTRTDVARKLRVSMPFVAQIEKGIKLPTAERLEQILKVLGLLDEFGNDLDPDTADEFRDIWFKEVTKDEEEKYLKYSSKKNLGNSKINNPSNPIPLKDTKIPVVSMVKGDDEMGFEFETLDPNEYEYIDFTNCKAVKITTNSMAPLAFKGQKIIYCEDQSVQDGDLVFIGLKSGEQYFKRYCKNRGKTITLEPLNIIHYRSMTIKESDVSFLYKVVGVKF